MVEPAAAFDSGITPAAAAAAAPSAPATLALALAAPPPPPKRRGRPRKSEQQQHDQNEAGPKKIRRNSRQQQHQPPLSPPPVSSSLVGQPIHGVLDGSFDAGYILTVRVGQSDTILRGVVFGPGLCVPITRANDIAPNVKFATRTIPPPAPYTHHHHHHISNPSNPATSPLHLSNGSSAPTR